MIHSVNKNNKFFCAIVLLISMFLISGKAYACTDPEGEAGEQLFNTTHNVMQYCNGTNWIAMGAPGDDEKLWIANETHIYNSNTGNVGIGIASPEYKLDVTGTTRVTGSIFSHNTHGNITLASHNTANYGSYINLIRNSDGTYWHISGPRGDTDGSLGIFHYPVAPSSPLRLLTLTSAGNVGIGTASPAHKLHVNAGNLAVINNNATAVLGNMRTANRAELFLFSADANYPTDIMMGSGSISDSNSRWGISTRGTSENYSLQFFEGAGTGAVASFTPRLTVLSGGNVGIGTTSPNATLHINATSGIASTGLSGISINSTSAWGALMINSADSTKTLGIHFGAAANDLRFGRYANNFGAWEANPYVFNLDAPADTLMVNLHGNVGIGKGGSSTHKLDVAGSVRASTNYDLTSGVGKGLRFWESDSYKISMGNTAEYQYGPITDYSIKTAMSNTTTRGWTWGVAGSTPVAAINTQGNMQLAGFVNIMGTTAVSGVNNLRLAGTANAPVIIFPSGGSTDFAHITPVTGSDTYDLRLYLSDNADGSEKFSVWSRQTPTWTEVERFNISSNGNAYFHGNVGIGTTSPSAKLTVMSSSSSAIYAATTSSTGWHYGVTGESASTDAKGVYGRASSSSGTTYGVYGLSLSSSGYGVYGWSTGSSGYGVYCQSGWRCGGDKAWTNTSDARLKEEVKDIDLGLDFIEKLRPVSYKWKTDPRPKDKRLINFGFLAQEVEPLMNGQESHLVGKAKEMEGSSALKFLDGDDSSYSITYTEIIAPLVKAVQELNQQKQEENAKLMSEIEQLRAEIREIKSAMGR